MSGFASATRSAEETYRLLTALVVPRPVGWVATRSRAGAANLAPFSFFNAVSDRPPTVAFSVGSRRGETKDTVRNLIEHPEFVVHIAGCDLADAVAITSLEVGPEVDEFALASLTPLACSVVDVPRVAEARVALECRLRHVVIVGDVPFATHHFIGEVLWWHLAPELVGADGRIDTRALDPIARLGSGEYARLGERFVPRGTPAPGAAPGSPARAEGRSA